MESTQLFNLAPWVVFLPLIGLVINLLVGKKLGEVFAGVLASAATGLAFVVSILLAVALSGHHEGTTVVLGDWITIGDFTSRWAFRVDTLSVVMMLVVSGVGLLIHIYSIGYMHNDVRHNGDTGRFTRFFVFMNLFIAAMMILVTADNFLSYMANPRVIACGTSRLADPELIVAGRYDELSAKMKAYAALCRSLDERPISSTP